MENPWKMHVLENFQLLNPQFKLNPPFSKSKNLKRRTKKNKITFSTDGKSSMKNPLQEAPIYTKARLIALIQKLFNSIQEIAFC
jgi:hypothetical protein